MIKESSSYYRWLAEKEDRYLTLARIYVPLYDILVKSIVSAVKEESERLNKTPFYVLDVGCGVGNIAYEILKSVTSAYLTGIDVEENMIKASKQRLDPYLREGRAFIKQLDVLELSEKEKYDVVYTNLVLHNLPLDNKKEALKKIYETLRTQGLFIWGDTIVFGNEDDLKAMWHQRIAHAIDNGALEDPYFFIKNFYKEMYEDHSLTSLEMCRLLKETNFSLESEIIDARYGFALFLGRKQD